MIEVKDVSFVYPDGYEGLKNISFTIREGESVGIIGANGAGKSTLMRVLMGLLEFQGEIRIQGMELNNKNLPEIRKVMGMVFQNPDDQIFHARVEDDILFGPRNYGEEEKIIKEREERILAGFHQTQLKGKYTHKLSGGEKRIAALAGVLIMEPDVILMDEPVSYLDPRARKYLIAHLKELSQTKLITSHDLDMTAEVCSRVLLLHEGRLAADGPAKEILWDEELLTSHGLELPLSAAYGRI